MLPVRRLWSFYLRYLLQCHSVWVLFTISSAVERVRMRAILSFVSEMVQKNVIVCRVSANNDSSAVDTPLNMFDA